jgi:hypothetical protein
VLAQPVVDPAAAHTARGHQVGDRHAVGPGRQQHGPQRRFRLIIMAVAIGLAVSGRLRGFCGRLGDAWRGGRERGSAVGVPRGVPGYLLIVYQVGAVPFRHAVLGIGNQEWTRLGELVSVPASFKCAMGPDFLSQTRRPTAKTTAAGLRMSTVSSG